MEKQKTEQRRELPLPTWFIMVLSTSVSISLWLVFPEGKGMFVEGIVLAVIWSFFTAVAILTFLSILKSILKRIKWKPTLSELIDGEIQYE